MRLSSKQAREWFAKARVARLATVDPSTAPHIVPVTFAVVGDAVVFAVDHKPKTTTKLSRLSNIAANEHVCALVDEYHEDWEQLWWVRADGTARIVRPADSGADHRASVRALCDKYAQYAVRPPDGVVVWIDVSRWSGWSGREDVPPR
ncbi:MAG: TIGR03668 family PPOX class F420-dependent oxidoreductase [Haloechinothrix sp.]